MADKQTPVTEDATKEKMKLFLVALAAEPNVSQAAKLAGLSRAFAYELKHRDPEFANAWDHAMGQSVDNLEAALFNRAIKGVEEPVFWQGQQVGTVTKYDNRLGLGLLRAHKKEYNPTQRVDANVATNDSGVTVEEWQEWRKSRLNDAVDTMALFDDVDTEE